VNTEEIKRETQNIEFSGGQSFFRKITMEEKGKQ
jgi:hypothetical protein